MPLTARLEGELIRADVLQRDAWEQLRLRIRREPSSLTLRCGSEATLRVSPANLQHFVHRRGAPPCGWGHAPMTAEHLGAQRSLLDAARDAGWIAEDEVPAPDGSWRADVLATRPQDGFKVAFEVQWSQQTLADYHRRQAAYARSDVRTAWFSRRPTFSASALGSLPVFSLQPDDEGGFVVRIGEVTAPLQEAALGLLQGRWQWCTRAETTVHCRVVVVRERCWRCDKTMTQWCVVEEHVISAHGEHSGFDRGYGVEGPLWMCDRREAHVDVIAVAQGHALPSAPLARLDCRSSTTSGHKYLAFCCPHCDGLQGDAYWAKRFRRYGAKPWIASVEIDINSSTEHEHWCDGPCRTM